jgi:uncharacterized integral membrane protein (TIGR00698 family)
MFGLIFGNLFLQSKSKSSEKFKTLIEPGQNFSSSFVLKTGIVCVGAKLSLTQLLSTGMIGVPIVACSMALIIGASLALSKTLRIERKLAALIAIGSGVCGVTAVSALAPAIGAKRDDLAASIAGVVVFGTTAMIALPLALHHIGFTDANFVGTFLGLAIHDTSQAIGAAMSFAQLSGNELALAIATTTKLTRFYCSCVVRLSSCRLFVK